MTPRKAAAKDEPKDEEPKATSEVESATGEAQGEEAVPTEEVPTEEVPTVEEAPRVEEPAPTPLTEGLVRFIPSSNTTGTVTESGATFSLAPGVPVKMTAADAEALAAEGLGSVQGD